MNYVVAWLIPPAAILFKGRFFQAFFCGCLWLVSLALVLCFGLGLIPLIACIIWACAVVGGANADRRMDRFARSIRR